MFKKTFLTVLFIASVLTAKTSADSLCAPMFKDIERRYPSYSEFDISLFPFFLIKYKDESTLDKNRLFFKSFSYDGRYKKDPEGGYFVQVAYVSQSKKIYRLFFYRVDSKGNWKETKKNLMVRFFK